MAYKTAYFRFYEELNDFLDNRKKKRLFPYRFQGAPSIKDTIEAIGVPHTEVDLILVNSTSVAFNYHLQHGDRVSVYPVFESLDISPLIKLRPKPLRNTKFVLDVHLGKLARLLRMLGFDTRYKNDYSDSEIVKLSLREKRIILTRDLGILKIKAVTHGYWVRSVHPLEQAREACERFDLLSQVKPFHRCIVCNGIIEKVNKTAVATQLPARIVANYDEFFQCSACAKIYWRGSHYDKMKVKIAYILQQPVASLHKLLPEYFDKQVNTAKGSN